MTVVPATVFTNPTLQLMIDSAVSEVELHNQTLAPLQAIQVPSDFNLNPSKHFVHLSSAPSSHPAICLHVLVVVFKKAAVTAVTPVLAATAALQVKLSEVLSGLQVAVSEPQAPHFPVDNLANPFLQVVHEALSEQTEHPSMQALHVLAVVS